MRALGPEINRDKSSLGNHKDVTMSAGHALAIEMRLPRLGHEWQPILARAALLVDHERITQPAPLNPFYVFHNLMLDRHALIDVEGMAAESMRRLPKRLRQLPQEKRPRLPSGAPIAKSGFAPCRAQLMDLIKAFLDEGRARLNDIVEFRHRDRNCIETYRKRCHVRALLQQVNTIRQTPKEGLTLKMDDREILQKRPSANLDETALVLEA